MTHEERMLLDEVHTMVRQLLADVSIIRHEVLRLRGRVAELESVPPNGECQDEH